MDTKALKWWHTMKQTLQQIILTCPAKDTGRVDKVKQKGSNNA
jgi:hypothetical protein